jgi:Tfp pilus assembly protein PilO
LHDWLGLIDKSAFKHGLRLNRGDYKFTQIKQGQIAGNQYASRYEIVLPVTGQYVQIRQFIANVLQSQPALALSSVKIQRDNTLATNVEARLVFVLFLQGDSL